MTTPNDDPPMHPDGYGAGTIAHFDGEWVITDPHDIWFSSRTMVATHFWKYDKWSLIWEDDEPHP